MDALPLRPVAVVIPHRDGASMLAEVLDALARQTRRDYELVVVSDGAGPESRQLAERHRTRPAWVEVRGGPRGFAAAANAGIRATRAPLVALLNDDAVPEPDWLENLVAGLEAAPAFALAGSRIRFLYSPGVIDSAGDTLAACGQPYRVGHRMADGPLFDRPAEVFGISACAALYRRSMLLDVGLFDEDFVSVYEDVDLSWRAFSRGHRALYVPGARVRHRGSATLGRSAEAYRLDQRNVEWLLFKNLPASVGLRALPQLLVHRAYAAFHAARCGRLGLFLRAKLEALAGLVGWIPKRRRELLEARRPAAALVGALDWGYAWQRLRGLLGRPVPVLPHRLRELPAGPDPAASPASVAA